jgi:DNA-binding XRE family transcriptional regulator
MRFEGRVFRAGRFWAVEVPILNVVSQGRSRKEALEMIADAIETLACKDRFRIEVFPGKREHFEIGSSDPGVMTALLLRRARQRSGLTLADVAGRMGSASANSYARYEQGKVLPSIRKLAELLAAVGRPNDLVLAEGRA